MSTKQKLKRLNLKKAGVKKAVVPALANTGAAVVGGLAGSGLGRASGLLGLAGLVTGAITGKVWVTAVGAGMLTAGIAAAGGANLKTSPTGKTDLKTEMHNGKERAKAFGQMLKEKFFLDKLLKKKADKGELGRLDHAAFADLDRLERSVTAEAFDHRAGNLAPADPLPALMEPVTKESDFSRF